MFKYKLIITVDLKLIVGTNIFLSTHNNLYNFVVTNSLSVIPNATKVSKKK